jgi:hypothetical protein
MGWRFGACVFGPRMLGLGVGVVNGMLHWCGMVIWGGYNRELSRFISAYCVMNRTLLCGGVRTCCVPSSCSRFYRCDEG